MQSMKEIKELLSRTAIEDLPKVLEALRADERKGVQQAILGAEKRIVQHEAELERLEMMLTFERECYQNGYDLIAGIDEVGRGPLAGPVVSAAVILPKDCKIAGVNDSKKLSAKKREALYEAILEQAVSYGIGIVSPERIDEINILQATYEAMREALSKLSPVPRFILADAVTIPEVPIPQKGIVQGDGKSLSIAAASIVAKVYRDRLMAAYGEAYPEYGFEKNMGYGSAEHIAAIRVHGLTPIHRNTFVKNFVGENNDSNRQKGAVGEELACKQIMKMGFSILERNYRRQGGEIDIIAKKDNLIVFVEVKFRKGREMGEPSEAVTKAKQHHIIETAKKYIAEQNLDTDFRFDVAEVLEENGKKFFRYTESAFWVE